MNTLNKRIKALCEQKGLKFRPWEYPPPWEITDADAENPHLSLRGDKWWPKVVALRAALKAELKQ
jgi:hypothetical protein